MKNASQASTDSTGGQGKSAAGNFVRYIRLSRRRLRLGNVSHRSAPGHLAIPHTACPESLRLPASLAFNLTGDPPSRMGNYPAITQTIESPHQRAASQRRTLAQWLVGLTVWVVHAAEVRFERKTRTISPEPATAGITVYVKVYFAGRLQGSLRRQRATARFPKQRRCRIDGRHSR